MPLSPDLLNLSSAAPRGQSLQPGTAEPAAETGRGRAAAFAELYERSRERQEVRPDTGGKTVREPAPARPDTAGKPAPSEAVPDETAESDESVEESPVAEDARLDPWLLFGLVAEPVRMGVPAEGGAMPIEGTGAPGAMLEAEGARAGTGIAVTGAGAAVAAGIHDGKIALADQDLSPPGGAMLANPSDSAGAEAVSFELALAEVGESLPEAVDEPSGETGGPRLPLIALSPPEQARAAAAAAPPLALQQPGLSEALVDRVMWLSSQNLKSAEIQLDPAELGRMEVRIELVKDQAQVTFVSPHAGVREALEGQLSRLRDMFGQQGLNLLDVNVSDQSQARGWQGQGQGGQRQGGGAGQGAGSEEVTRGVTEVSAGRSGDGRGMVDYYA